MGSEFAYFDLAALSTRLNIVVLLTRLVGFPDCQAPTLCLAQLTIDLARREVTARTQGIQGLCGFRA